MNEHERINAAVKKYIDGDKKAFTEIYELTYQATYYYVIGAVKNKEAAEDIISDTYLEVVKSIGTLSSPKAFVSWLRTIAHSKICRYFKKNGREVLVTEEEEPIFDTLENENEEFIPAVALEKESDRNEIIRIINGLSDVQKQAVFMHYFDKMPVAKIAEAMECSENTVKSRLGYARKALKDMFVAEEKKGNKFYSVAPFMFMLFSEEVQAVRVSAELSKRIIESAEIGAAATAGSGIIGTIKGFFSTAAGKFAAASTAAKAGIGVGVAAVVATACIVPAVVNDDEVVDVVVEETSVITTVTTVAETVEESVEATPIEMFEIEFSEDNTYAIISKYIGDEVDVVIPDEVDGVPIREIGRNAFNDSDIKSIKFPDTLKKIDEYAFYWCSKIEKISLPDGFETFSKASFSCCRKLKEVNIPPLVTEIPYECFNNTNIESIELQDNITVIGRNAFSQCPLKNVILPESVTTIGGFAFEGCKQLETIYLPDSITEIGQNAFDGCKKLNSVTIPKDMKKIDFGVFGNCTSLTEIIIPSNITTIADYSFRDCKNLTSVTLPNTIKSIPQSAFENTGIEEIIVPQSVKKVSYTAFKGCTNLKKVVLPVELEEIGYKSFADCENLTDINIPATIEKIDETAFNGTPIEETIKSNYAHAIK